MTEDLLAWASKADLPAWVSKEEFRYTRLLTNDKEMIAKMESVGVATSTESTGVLVKCYICLDERRLTLVDRIFPSLFAFFVNNHSDCITKAQKEIRRLNRMIKKYSCKPQDIVIHT
jgi:hypothetical protein